jgi:hypothetical protein
VVAAERLPDASLMMRTGYPCFLEVESDPAFAQMNGSLTICRCAPGRKPSETASNSQSETNGLICFTVAPGVNFRPDLNFLPAAREIISFTFEPPTSITRILFFKIAFGV